MNILLVLFVLGIIILGLRIKLFNQKNNTNLLRFKKIVAK